MAKFKSQKPANAVNDVYFKDGEVKREAKVKSKSVAGVLSFFLGFSGIHQFYLKNTGKGIVCIVITLILTAVFIINSAFSLDMSPFICAVCVYEAILVIQGLIYIFESEKRFKKTNKVRTF